MSERPDTQSADHESDGTFDATRRRQIRAGLELDHAARLRWLEEWMTELIRLQGKANPGRSLPSR